MVLELRGIMHPVIEQHEDALGRSVSAGTTSPGWRFSAPPPTAPSMSPAVTSTFWSSSLVCRTTSGLTLISTFSLPSKLSFAAVSISSSQEQ